jgi:5'-nucleotidase/UDP-sugar diphosphatase
MRLVSTKLRRVGNAVTTRGYSVLRRSCVAILAALALALGGSGVASSETPRVGADSLVILHTNDLHSHLLPFRRSEDLWVGGAAARAALIDRARSRTPDLLLLDAGDVIQGTPAYNLFRGVPDTRSMSLMRYDAVALGNHDLDDGPAAWRSLRAFADYRVLSANVFAAAESSWGEPIKAMVAPALRAGARWVGGARVADAVPLRYLARPYEIREWRGLRIAILGLTTGDLTHIVRISANRGVAVADPIAVARILVPELRTQADLVIALTHIGLDQDRKLAEKVPGIDLIVGGHSHTRLFEPEYAGTGAGPWASGVPIVQTGSWGDRIGRTVLYLSDRRVAGVASQLLTVRPDQGEDSLVAAMLRPVADSVSAVMDSVVFHSPERVPMHDRDDAESPIGNFAADILREAAGADVGLYNTGGIRAPIPRGPVTVGDVYSVFPFDNTIVVLSIPGDDLRRLLDFVARRVGRRGFATVSGVSFRISRGYATDIRVGGQRLQDKRIYRVATLDYLFEGGDGFTMLRDAKHAEATGIYVNQAAIAFLRRNPNYRFRSEGRIVWEGGTPALRDLPTR